MPKDSVSPTSRKLPEKLSHSEQSNRSLLVVGSLSVILLASFVSLVYKLSQPGCDLVPYNSTSLSTAVTLDDGTMVFKIVVVTDLDHESKHPTKKNTWQSYMKKGILTISADKTKATVDWNDNEQLSLQSHFAAGGRSMELSDLVEFDGRLLSVDDRTGIIYEINNGEARPWVFLSDGPGNATKGFKAEWMTVKDKELYVGGLGKEWTTTEGVFVNHNPMWIKRVTPSGCVSHIKWVREYKKLRSAAGIEYPGYMIHESAQWSAIHRKWFFMPRRASKEMYTEADDEHRGTNYLLIASEDFDSVEVKLVGTHTGSRGFSAFQFIPGTNDQLIVALKSEEKDGIPVASYITVFDHKKDVILLDEQPLKGAYKYEGIAFV
uniref:Soluble calcium-activated nucleotidase 1 n=1 Tax=Syphacia muris TaxID=451379 RepID=A0A0N5AKV6_9BILA